MNNETIEANRRIHEWLGDRADWHCYVPSSPDPECDYCDKELEECVKSNPRYDKESGFFALLTGLRAKGFAVNTFGSPKIGSLNCATSEYQSATLVQFERDTPNPSSIKEFHARADTLPEALFQAAIKAMILEEKAD